MATCMSKLECLFGHHNFILNDQKTSQCSVCKQTRFDIWLENKKQHGDVHEQLAAGMSFRIS